MAKRVKQLIGSVIVLTMLCTILGNALIIQAKNPGSHPIHVSGSAKFINTWLMAGPFESSHSINPSITPAERVDLDSEQWEYFDDRLFNRNLDDYQDLYGYYTVKKKEDVGGKKVYAHVYAYSPSKKDAQFRIGSTGHHTVWVNGTEVGNTPATSEVGKDRNRYSISLNEGWNSILVELNHDTVYYLGFYGRITDSNGDAIEGLIYSVNGDSDTLAISTKGLSFTENNMPIGYKDWPYVWIKSIRGTADWTPQASNFEFYAEGGVPDYTWSIENGALPDGLTLAEDGTIDGRPTTIGVYNFTLKVEDSNNAIATKELTIEVKERPNKWHEEARQSALIHNTSSYNDVVDENYSYDLWAQRMKKQGINFVYLEAYQAYPNGFFWPAPSAQEGAKDRLTKVVEAIKRYDIKFGLYYGGIPTWDQIPYYSSSGFVQDVEDLIKRYAPKQFFFDGYPNAQGNTDAMYSIVRAYDPEIIIEANPDPDLGDCDTKIWEAHQYWGNPAPDYWKNPDTKGNPLEIWRHPYTSEMGSGWAGYHYGSMLDDWEQFAKINMIQMSLGYISNFDQMIQNCRVLEDGTVQQGMELDVFAPTVQKIITMREMYANWMTPSNAPSKLESVIGTYPGPLNIEKWGYSTQRDNKIYVHMIEHPEFFRDGTGDVSNTNKTGMPANSITVSPIDNNATKVTLLNDGRTLDFTQNGNELTIDLSGVKEDSIDTIIKIETDKQYEGYDLTGINVSGEKVTDNSIQLTIEGFLNDYAALRIINEDFDNITYVSSNTSVAQVDENGIVTSVAEGLAEITVLAEYKNVTKEDVIQIMVEPSGYIRVNEELIGAVIKVDGYETYEKMFHLNHGEITLEGIGVEGNQIDLNGAKVTYKTDMPQLLQIIDDKVVLKAVQSPVRAAVWADVELEQKQEAYKDIVFWDPIMQRMFKVPSILTKKVQLTTNKVFIEITPFENVALNKPVTDKDGNATNHANDGIIHNFNGEKVLTWVAPTGETETYWQVDLGKVQSIHNVNIRYNSEDSKWKKVPNSVTIQVSEDGTNWNTVVDKSTNVPSEDSTNKYSYFDLYNYSTEDTDARYVKLVFEDAQQEGIEIPEIEVYSSDISDRLANVFVSGQEVQAGIGNLSITGTTLEDNPIDLTDANIKVISTNTDVVSVNSDNTLCAENDGTTKVYVVVEKGNDTKVGSIIVNVDQSGNLNFEYPIENVILTSVDKTLEQGQSTDLNVSSKLTNGQDKDLTNATIVYSILEGEEHITIDGNTVTLSSAPANNSTAMIQATITIDDAIIKSNILELTLVGCNVALNKIPTYSCPFGPEDGAGITTNGVVNTSEYLNLNDGGLQYMQLDLEKKYDIDKLRVWHYFADGRIYKDVIFQLSNDPEFKNNVITVFNNDTDNSSGLGEGSDSEYTESASGKEVEFDSVNARYVRLWSNGSNSNAWNHYVEVEVHGSNNLPTPKAPSVTADDENDVLVGADNTMEYSTDGGNTWIPYDDQNVPTFAGDITVQVRVAEVDDKNNAGEVTEVTFTATFTVILSSVDSSLKQGQSTDLQVSAKLSNDQDKDITNATIAYNIVEGLEYITINENTVTLSSAPANNSTAKFQATVTLDGVTVSSNILELTLLGRNRALNIIPTSSCSMSPDPGILTDGIVDTNAYLNLNAPDLQWMQLDLGKRYDIDKLRVWHYFVDGRTYKDVIFQLSNDPEFKSGVITVFNNDTDNSAGLGTGTDSEYAESANGKEVIFNSIKARYVRLWSNGSYSNGGNHYVEVEVHGSEVLNADKDLNQVTIEADKDQLTAIDEKANLSMSGKLIDGTVADLSNAQIKWVSVENGKLVTLSNDTITLNQIPEISSIVKVKAIVTLGDITVNSNELEISVVGEGENIAPLCSQVNASSSFDDNYAGTKAIDCDVNTEWASAGDPNPSIQLDWNEEQTIYKIILQDRENPDDNIGQGTLTFSDNSTIAVTDIPADGSEKEIIFESPKTITWVKFEATGNSGGNNGLKEFKVFKKYNQVVVDTDAPTITFEPADAETNVTTDGAITITFNEAVTKLDDSALENADLASMLTLKKTDVNGVDVTFTATVDADKKVITITPVESLDNSQVYYVEIAAEVEDESDNAITAANATFTTIAP